MNHVKHPRWMSYTLLAAALYNALWGLWVGLFPKMSFDLLGMEAPKYLPLWQSVGLMVGCYAIGYFLAAFDPYKLWGIVLVGFIGKVLGPLGMVYAVATDQLPLAFAWNNITNDVIWWIPFFLILRGAYQHNLAFVPRELQITLEQTQTSRGRSLWQATQGKTLLVALRHSGCTFCRETMAELQAKRQTIESSHQIILLLLEDDPAMLGKFGLHDLERVVDPDKQVYAALELRRGTIGQLFGLASWLRGFEAGIVRGHGLGWMHGDGLQMPGSFLLDHGQVIKAHRHKVASEQLDHEAFCQVRVG